jgi:hypothetical protein
MMEALLLCVAVGCMVLLIRNSTRLDTENPDELLGLFAYKQDRNDPGVAYHGGGKHIA